MEIHFFREEQACKDIYKITKYRVNRKFVVTLLLKEGMELGKYFEMAYKKFGLLEKRLSRNKLKESYAAFMEEYNVILRFQNR